MLFLFNDEIMADYEKYKFIHKPVYTHDPAQVLDNKYKSIEELGARFVVYSTEYRVYKSRGDFLAHLEAMPEEERIFHEVIFSIPQKIKIDIDVAVAKLTGQDLNAVYNNIFESVLDAVRMTFLIEYKIDLCQANEIICESHGAEKFSNHIIIDGYYVTAPAQAAEFTRRMRGFMPSQYHEFVDMAVNKSIQNFRLVSCHKIGNNRVKHIVTKHSPESSIISNITGCKKLPDLICATKKEIDITHETLCQASIDNVLSLCKEKGILDANTYKYTSGNTFLFTRVRPEYCKICAKEHTNDNSVLVSVSAGDGVMTVFQQCRRYIYNYGRDGNHFILLGQFPANVVTNDKAIKNACDDITTGVKKLPKLVTHLQFDDLPACNKHIYAEPTLRPFEPAGTLIVHAAMKMGKTKALLNYMDTYFKDGLRKNIIRILSFRQTFSGNIKEKFGDFVLYSDISGQLTQPRLIIQVESLHRLDISAGCEPPDLLILDECESIFEQFDSGLLRGNFNDCFAKFQYMLRYAKHVVCMDAYVTNRTYRILKHMRVGVDLSSIVYHRNEYKNACDDEYFITNDKLKWLGVLYSTIDADERVAVPISSLLEAKIIANNLTKKYPNKRIKLYSSEMSFDEKREHFADVNTYWAQYDVIIYTPTISAGVSFEKCHFTRIFGYFTDQSCPVETCIQMIGRIRDVAEHQLFIYVSSRGAAYPMDIDDIKSQALSTRGNLMKNFDGVGVRVEYGELGEQIYYTTDYFHIWADNTLSKNISKNIFTDLFIYRAGASGARVSVLTDEIYELHTGEQPIIDGELSDLLTNIKNDHTTVRTEIKQVAAGRIVAAADISQDEADVIRNNLMMQVNIPARAIAEYDRYKLRRAYNYHGEITEGFVKTYNDSKIRRIFKNNSKVLLHDNIDTILQNIQREESSVHMYLTDVSDQIADINKIYMFDKHRYTLGLIKILGWSSLRDPIAIHISTIMTNISREEKLTWEYLLANCREFGIKAPRMGKITDVLAMGIIKVTSRIMANIYGARISAKNDIYTLSPCELFTTDPALSTSKNIPLIAAI